MRNKSVRLFHRIMLFICLLPFSHAEMAAAESGNSLPAPIHFSHASADKTEWEAILSRARAALGWGDSGFVTGGGGNIYIEHRRTIGGQCSADPFIEENSEYAFLDIGGSWPTAGDGETLEEFSFHSLPARMVKRVNSRGNLTRETLAWEMSGVIFKAYMAIACPEDGGVVDVLPYAEALYSSSSSGTTASCSGVTCSADYCSEDNSTLYYDCTCDPSDGECYCYMESCPAGCDPQAGACNPYEEPTLSVSPTPPAADLRVENIVLLQAIQGGKLAARKPTALRVFLNSSFNDQNQEVVVSLSVDGISFGEQTYLLKPRKYTQDMTKKELLEIKNVKDSANYYLPADMLGGYIPHTFTASARWADPDLIDPDLSNNSFQLSDVNFIETRSVNILFEPWAGDISAEAMGTFIRQARSDVLNMMPVQGIPHIVTLPFDTNWVDELTLGLPLVNPYTQFDKLRDITWKRRLYNAKLDAGLASGKRMDMSVGVFHEYQQGGGTIRGNSWAAWWLYTQIHQSYWVAVERPSVIVHEMGHQLFGDEYTAKSQGIPLPYGSVIYYGQQKQLEYLDEEQLYLGRIVNIMGSDHLWPRIETWDAFVDYYSVNSQRQTGFQTQPPKMAMPPRQEDAGLEGYMLSGSITSGGAVENTYGLWLANQEAEQAFQGDSDYWLEAIDGNGSQLSVQPVWVDFSIHDPALFSVFLPVSKSATAEIRLLREGEVIWSNRPSGNLPEVSFSGPAATGGELSGELPVNWQAADGDGQKLRYALLYSADGGLTWLPLSVNTKKTEVQIDLDSLPGCQECQLRVIASDGWHEKDVIAPEPFAIKDKSPTVSILTPEDQAEISEDEPFTLSAAAYDLEEGLLPEERIIWNSDRDGALGTGSYIHPESLSAGKHRITATVSDSRNQQTQAEIEITILRGEGPGSGMTMLWVGMAALSLLAIIGSVIVWVIMKRKGKRNVVTLAIILLAVSTVCCLASGVLLAMDSGITGGSGDRPESEPTTSYPEILPTLPAATAPPADSGGNQPNTTQVTDDFSAPGGWPQPTEERYSAGLAEGGIYRIDFWQAGDYDLVVVPQPHEPRDAADMIVKVVADGMNESGAYGLVCRQSGTDLYGFHVANDGRYWVYKSTGGNTVTLDIGSNPAIRDERNQLELQCLGNQIISYANGALVSQVTDDDLKRGNAGLFAQPLGGDLVGAWSFYATFDDFYAEFREEEGVG